MIGKTVVADYSVRSQMICWDSNGILYFLSNGFQKEIYISSSPNLLQALPHGKL